MLSIYVLVYRSTPSRAERQHISAIYKCIYSLKPISLPKSNSSSSLDLSQIDLVSNKRSNVVQPISIHQLGSCETKVGLTAYSLDHCWTFTTHTPTQHSDVLGDTHWFQHLWTEDTGLICQLQVMKQIRMNK
jgi:hypothetical protein